MRDLLNSGARLGYRLAYLMLRVWWFVRRPATHGVGVALWHQDRVLLVRTSYRALLSLPGGFVKLGESPGEAARRELLEELGIAVATEALRPTWQGTARFESRLDTMDVWEMHVESPPETRCDGWEVVWAGWMTPSEALKKRLLPHVALYLAQIRGAGPGPITSE